LEAENQRLGRALEEISQTLASVSADADRDRGLADSYRALANVYSSYSRSQGRLPDLEEFLGTREIKTAFPGFSEQVLTLFNNQASAGYREGLFTVTEILDVSTRIRNDETRRRYLRAMESRYHNEPNIQAFLSILIRRFTT
jgi:hypothetical protein